ncbi:MAG: universal stress protein [Bacteriovoracaceae bacterium]|nr:universal stress protein [Bacteriovoracaceae bacterium]
MWEKSNILICTDFTLYSDQALRAAEVIRKKNNATLHALHVTEYPVEWNGSVSNDLLPHYLDDRFDIELFNLSKDKLDQQIKDNDIHCQGHVSMGVAYSVIHQFIRDNNINLLIMGYKGKESSPFHLGSLAEKMVASTSIPILVVKGPFVIRKIAALFDPANPADEIVKTAEELGRFFSAKLAVVSLFKDIVSRFVGIGKLGFSTKVLSLTADERQEITDSIKKHIKNLLSENTHAEIKVETSVEKKLAYHLNSILTADHTDLAVMKRHHGDFLESMLIGSETRRLLELFERNLLILV